ncbi:4-diphosphocytidyl-2C-methyl-D-erythritol kinase [Defluviimonas sp. 20V17]|uniref:4-diphosphocytidyl-2-C-methyl-D-erythritol kinase n=1 Tax=Allgaiera indica TaxID=765699 RepID=A0AAN4UPI8_9RHOB|nr:4-(cytidine 5'-diphospho)-2-C-methyl-D-erythritol kinase [Allgaiera indica]KDB04717.1 4-diphosphocytidyl-2C-methyl-D-erythritol kinase [Defluviimonas sp. 20V17]GHD99076.1 4-diphosphocytidyl-2-C-methyl-D-erythritol kinase [Allgaiera indica]SDW00883.1 4-diphosphocytidyl-2-C-methyl-D-erythritol kinase [Allgaiera indica]
MAAEALAPAKINLTLHVIGRRADGYHLLDSLVAFVDLGDRVGVAPGDGLSLRVKGPRAAGVPADDNNLMLRAARLLAAGAGAEVGADLGAALTLEKCLPMAAGIGGGSSDAAAALRLLSRLWGLPMPDTRALMALGADLPVCAAARPARMRGLGERLDPAPALPPVWLVLANPGMALATPAVFGALSRPENAPMPETLPDFPDAVALAAWLRAQRNDLEPAATAICPAVAQVSAALAAQSGCLLARMSGSGATCFGVFASPATAQAAVAALRAARPDWWVEAAGLWQPAGDAA